MDGRRRSLPILKAPPGMREGAEYVNFTLFYKESKSKLNKFLSCGGGGGGGLDK